MEGGRYGIRVSLVGEGSVVESIRANVKGNWGAGLEELGIFAISAPWTWREAGAISFPLVIRLISQP